MSTGDVAWQVLQRVPDTWASFDRDDLTAAEEAALVELSRRGLIELRQNGRLILGDEPISFVFRVQYAGTGGQREAVFGLLKALTDHGYEGAAFSLHIENAESWRRSAQACALLTDDSTPLDPDYFGETVAFLLPPVTSPMNGMGTGKATRFERAPDTPSQGTDPIPVALSNIDDVVNALSAKKRPKPGPKPRAQDRVDRFLAGVRELRFREKKRPTLADWAAVIAADMARISGETMTPGAVQKQLKGRWDLRDRHRVDDGWIVYPARQ